MTERRGGSRAVWSEVDLDAIRANVRALGDLVELLPTALAEVQL